MAQIIFRHYPDFVLGNLQDEVQVISRPSDSDIFVFTCSSPGYCLDRLRVQVYV